VNTEVLLAENIRSFEPPSSVRLITVS
jgi:hypothetical protein